MNLRSSAGLRNGVANVGSYISLLENCVIEIRSGSQPASADDAASGTLLGTVTLDGGAFTPGSPTNGLNFELSGTTAGQIQKPSGDTWRMTGLANGTAGHFRVKANAADAGGPSTTAIRMDGSIGTSGADLIFSTLTVATGAPISIDRFELLLPASA